MINQNNLSEVILSVCMITYNQEKYIDKAIEGILMQKVNFKYEIIIGEDFSIDNTRKIVLEYTKKYPNIIKVIFHNNNVGPIGNLSAVFSECRGKYIAICEGDDYWIDPYKLQKQVSFLESYNEYGIVYTDVRTIDEYGNDIKCISHQQIKKRYQAGNIFVELFKSNFINTCTVVMRKEAIPKDLYNIKKNWFIYDYLLWLRIAINFQVHFINEVTACYRIHEKGISRAPEFKNKRKSYYLKHDALLAFDRENIRILTNDEQKTIFRKIISLLIQPYGTIGQKLSLFKILPSYYQGFYPFMSLIYSKLLKNNNNA